MKTKDEDLLLKFLKLVINDHENTDAQAQTERKNIKGPIIKDEKAMKDSDDELIPSFSKLMEAKKIREEIIGEYVICRSYSAGVHAGVVSAIDDNHVLLTQTRRLHGWKAKPSEEASVALNSVAKYGIDGDLRIDAEVKKNLINGFIELIPCEPDAEKSIREYVTKKD